MFKSVELFSVNTLEIGGLAAALQALRLPYGLECRSHVKSLYDYNPNESFCKYKSNIYLNEKDIKLLHTLCKRGDEHAKVLRGVMVWCEINAPRYFHQELDTYRIGCERLASESTMHIQGAGLSEDELIAMKESLTEDTMQKRVWMFSYQTLSRIYRQRKNHRLPQWRFFCNWVETLPYADSLIIGLDDGKSD